MTKYGHLYTPNLEVITGVFGDEFAEQSASGSLSVDSTLQANEALGELLYGSEVSSLLRAGHITQLGKLAADNLQEVSLPNKALEPMDLRTVGMVVIRPEIVELRGDCRDLLVSYGLSVVEEKLIELTFAQYWGMYHHGLVHPDAYHDFPTRTLNYIGKPSHLMIVTAGPDVTQGLTTSDYLTARIKGRQGVSQPATLRGDIAYNALRSSVSRVRKGAFKTPCDTIAHDPVGAYQHLVQGSIRSDGAHNTVDEPLLFYAAQGVHIPDTDEMMRDLSILCTEAEQEALAERLSASGVGKL